jgi:hypothetical protein
MRFSLRLMHASHSHDNYDSEFMTNFFSRMEIPIQIKVKTELPIISKPLTIVI